MWDTRWQDQTEKISRREEEAGCGVQDYSRHRQEAECGEGMCEGQGEFGQGDCDAEGKSGVWFDGLRSVWEVVGSVVRAGWRFGERE